MICIFEVKVNGKRNAYNWLSSFYSRANLEIIDCVDIYIWMCDVTVVAR